MKLAVRITKVPDKGYRAWCPALPGCEATGETWEMTLDAIQRAVDAYLASLDAVVPPKQTQTFIQASAQA
jgi:predicted RNase H-like HicB family nuclease